MIQYRYATIDDLDLLVKLRIRDLNMFSDKKLHDDTVQNIREFYLMGIQSQKCLTILGYDCDCMVASATIYYYTIMPSYENLSGVIGQLTNVWVDSDYRYQGIASSMVNSIIKESQNKVGMLCLNSSSDGFELYKKLGFVRKENYFVMYTE